MRVRLAVSVLAASASFFVASPMRAHAEGVEGTYRGSFVCEKLKQGTDMLRAPFDMNISGKTVVFARPVFNRNGTRVVGSELATGTIEDNGTLQVKSEWTAAGFGYQGSYNGAINGKVGTLTGTQAWKTRSGTETRNCTVAFAQRS
jgi:hypothetical protein